MAIQFVAVKCPACGADISADSSREFCFCEYCGSKVLLSNTNEHINRNIDEARLRETETERLIRLKELELEEAEILRNRKMTMISYCVSGAVALIGLIFLMIGGEIGLAGLLLMAVGGYIAFFTYIKKDKQSKIKRKYVSPNEVRISESMYYFDGENINSIINMYRAAGFINVVAVPLNDLSIISLKKSGQVANVTINGRDDFEEGDIFLKNSNVVVMFHSKG